MKLSFQLCTFFLGASLTFAQTTTAPAPAAETPAATPPPSTPAAPVPTPTTPSTSEADKTQKKVQNNARREKQFSRLDANSDTFVDREEFKKGRFAQKKANRAEKRFTRTDGNGDGKLSKDEWMAAPVRGKKNRSSV